ncbi:hypothetical protein H6F90_22305 [Trichocoleus sp. FACHB-591]|uniref:hypothetical protein n=1 Tax=Trichocoleus sp. FACHB-591 TaxID=2692872 RepID=UPI0016898AB3|nr:hypothetical protein [Trichocoleus sp. FACHB-591]MBD2097810.1 hypothetical protein [Trichocoleus sp. FACHB-591]
MKKLLYSGLIIVCLATVTMPAMAKGKPQKQQKPQKTEKISEQSSSTDPNLQPICQQSPLGTESKAANLRSNKGGKLRGQARAQYVHQLNQAKKQQRLAGQVPNACTGLPQLPSSSTTVPSTTTTSTSQTSTSVEINTVK